MMPIKREDATMTRCEELQGKFVTIIATTNQHAKSNVGSNGVVAGHAPDGMVIVILEGTGNAYWAYPYNLSEV
jgi:hypothetical protein